MIQISIVMPVYNAEKYLEESIKSVLCQTLRELEIVCIDDGSQDRSAEIIRQCQTEDERIRLFRQENQGAGAARNLGIREAHGKYIAFLDADDYYLDQDALALMYNACETKGVSVCGSLRKRLENGEVWVQEMFQEADKDTTLRYEDFQLDYDYQSFLFLKRHLTENGLFFPPYRRFQDPPFLVRALYEAGEFIVADTYLYCYRAPEMISRFNAEKTADLIRGLTDNLLFAKEHNLDILFRNTVSRLEYEYGAVICRNAATGNSDIMDLLSRANQIICSRHGKRDYVIRPLRVLSFDTESYEKGLLEKIQEAEEIVLYGAGMYGRIFLAFLEKRGFLGKVTSFVVSDSRRNKVDVRGIPVRPLQDERAFIFVTASEKAQEEIAVLLTGKGYGNYELVKTDFLDLC